MYRARDVSDVLNLLPTLFGFVPYESFIGVSLAGERRRFGFRLRVDLPAPHIRHDIAAVVAHHLEHAEGERLLLIAVSQDASSGRAMVEAVLSRLQQKQAELAIWATEDSWWRWGESQSHAWTRDPAHAAVVTAMSLGQVIHPNRAAVAREFAMSSDAADVVQVERMTHEVLALTESSPKSSPQLGVGEIHRQLEAPEIGAQEAATVAVWLRDVLVRDHFWFEVDESNSRHWADAWTQIARLVPHRLRCAPLGLASFCFWQLGDGARALLASEAALAEDRDYSMAQLMQRVVEQALPPSTWTSYRQALRENSA